MRNFNLITAGATAFGVLALSISALASASEYSEAMSSARSTYRTDMANCKTMSGDDRANCVHTAKATRHDAMANARAMRKPHEAQKHNEGDEPKLKN
jgi:hypothetical protein